MATSEQLVLGILRMTPAEQVALLKKNRLSRRTSKLPAKKKKVAAKAKKKPVVKATAKEIFKLMSPDQQEALLKQLLGGS